MPMDPKHIRAMDIMSPVPECIDSSTSLDELFKKVGAAPYVGILVFGPDKKICGAIRNQELLKARLTNVPETSTAKSIMVPLAEFANSNTSPQDCAEMMRRSKLRFVPVVDNNKCNGIVWADSNQIALTEAFKSQFAELEDAHKKIAYRDEFLGILVHDLRSPLAVISACTDLLKMGANNLPKPHVDMLDTIKRNSKRCIDLAQDLLEFGKLNSGLNVNFKIIEIEGFLEPVIKNLRYAANDYGVRLEFDSGGKIAVQADPDRLIQIVDNLVINACKVTPKGKNITIKTDLIDDNKRGNKALRISITDEGQGIPRDKIASIFDKYSQLDQPIEQKTGVGLGLSIVAQFVRLHNGDIHVDGGGDGLGATFAVVLPNASAMSTSVESPTHAGQPKVLVVDDDEDIREAIMDAIGSEPWDIRIAINGQDAYEIFATWDPDFVLTDIKMPVKSGIELLNDIKNSSPGTPVVLLSGALEAFDKDDISSSLRPDEYFTKPFKRDDLVAMIHRYLKET